MKLDLNGIKERLAASAAVSKVMEKIPGKHSGKQPNRKRRWIKFVVAGVALVVVAALVWNLLNPGQDVSDEESTYTTAEGIRMDDIVRTTKAEVQRLKYDKDGCLLLVEDGK